MHWYPLIFEDLGVYEASTVVEDLLVFGGFRSNEIKWGINGIIRFVGVVKSSKIEDLLVLEHLGIYDELMVEEDLLDLEAMKSLRL